MVNKGGAMNAKQVAKFKKILLDEKQRILTNSKKTLDSEINISPDDLPDETDLATTELSQNLIFKLRDRERQLLNKINDALLRMDQGNFGTCESCEEPIEAKRLEARPVSTLCLSCQEREEHREKIYA